MACCESCGAEIRFVRTKSGKHMPLDAKPEKRVIVVHHAGESEPVAEVVDTFVSHFATCPQAAQFRRSER